MPDHSVECWGRNGRGQVGDGTDTTPVTQPHLVSGLTAASLSLGGYHSCALLQDATVQCWGQSDYGQIGSAGTFSDVPVTVAGIVQHRRARPRDAAYLRDPLGRNGALLGQQRLGPARRRHDDFDVDAGDGPGHRQSAPESTPGWEHTCALMPDPSVWCWGENDYGELGNGTVVNSVAPVMMHETGLTWTSDTPSVATVNSTGVVTGVSRGTATITVTDPFGNSGSATVTVRRPRRSRSSLRATAAAP